MYASEEPACEPSEFMLCPVPSALEVQLRILRAEGWALLHIFVTSVLPLTVHVDNAQNFFAKGRSHLFDVCQKLLLFGLTQAAFVDFR